MTQFSEAATKDGLPRSAFAYTPTAEPSTWKLPFLTASGAPDPDHLPGAAAALSSGGFRGQKADIPSSAIPSVKARLRQAYRRWGKSTEEWPDSIREEGALVEQFLDQQVALLESDEDDAAIAMAIAEMEARYREAGDDHFYGPWKGGSKGAGGRPAGGKATVGSEGGAASKGTDEVSKLMADPSITPAQKQAMLDSMGKPSAMQGTGKGDPNAAYLERMRNAPPLGPAPARTADSLPTTFGPAPQFKGGPGGGNTPSVPKGSALDKDLGGKQPSVVVTSLSGPSADKAIGHIDKTQPESVLVGGPRGESALLRRAHPATTRMTPQYDFDVYRNGTRLGLFDERVGTNADVIFDALAAHWGK